VAGCCSCVVAAGVAVKERDRDQHHDGDGSEGEERLPRCSRIPLGRSVPLQLDEVGGRFLVGGIGNLVRIIRRFRVGNPVT
jgi:hypothetical protein